MFGGLNPITALSMTLSRNCKNSVKIGYNVTSVICRNKTTVTTFENDQRSVADFYTGRSVFITGGTGFLGKMFIEKLLYSCKDIDKVFILIRNKKGQSTEQRLQQMLNNPIFDRVKKAQPQNMNKVIPIIGDICEPNLGINPKDEETLKDSVSVVFHSAATIKFNEPMDVAMNINYEGTRRVVDLCRRLKALHNFVHISTAFSQTHLPETHEKVYPAPAEVKDIYSFIKKYNHDIKKTEQFIGDLPNTYIYTKCLTENYVATITDLPVTIIRPALVGAAANEPLPGWVDNWFAITGVVFDIARGLNHYVAGDANTICDFVPVDYVTNLTLVAGAKYKRGNTIPVYNSATSVCNPVSWGQCFQTFINENLRYGCYESTPYVKHYKSDFMLDLVTMLFLKTPAYAADLLLRLKGEKPRNLDQIKRVILRRSVISEFMKKNKSKYVDQTRALYASLSEADQAEFPFDPATINWDTYLKNYFEGVTTYLLPNQLIKENKTFVRKVFTKAS